MVKQTLCSMALVAGLIAFLGGSVAAQEAPKPAISDYFLVRPSPAVMSENFPKPADKPAKQPAYCNPCLFYGGDFNPSDANANGLTNEVDLVVPSGSEVLVPFTVPKGEAWFVSGLFTNNLSNYGVLDPPQANWSISKGVTTGSGGHTIAHGTAHATSKPTGRSAFGLTEYTVLVNTPLLLLAPGTYWMAVVPICTNAVDSACVTRFYASDTEESPPLNHYGPLEPNDMSYLNSAFFGANYDPATNWCTGVGCDRFSAGVLGF